MNESKYMDEIMESEKAWDAMEKAMEKKGHKAESTILKMDGCMDEMIVLLTWGKNEYVVHHHTPENGAYYWGHYFLDYKSAWNFFLKKVEKNGLRVRIELDQSERQ